MLQIFFSTLIILISSLIIDQSFPIQHSLPSNSFDQTANQAIFNNHPVALPSNLAFFPLPPKVLGSSTSEKRIYVDLTNQRLYAYEGDNLVYNFLISSGKYGKTPTGIFNIWAKFRYTRMKGGSVALGTYYDLPNVPYTMFFENDKVPGRLGFSLHGTYWHSNFGHPMSHGCVNMRTSDAAILYDWTSPYTDSKTQSNQNHKNEKGTEIIIYGTTPKS